MLLSILLRSLVLLRQTIATLLCAICLLGALLLVLPYAPAAAKPVANVPTASPAPPTAEPPTAIPPTAEPPVAEPPTAIPPTAEPPVATPESAPPTATTPPQRPEHHKRPTATAEPPTATSAPEPSPSAPPAAEVQIAKSVDAEQRQRGDTALYSIRVSNTGGSLARDVVVNDEVPAALEIIDLKSSKGDIIASGQRVTAYPSTLEPGEEATLLVRVRVRADAPAGSLINLAQVTTSSPGDNPGNNSDTARLTVIVPAVRPTLAPVQRLPHTAEVALGPALPWWLPWIVLALGLMVLGSLLTYRVEPALRRMIAAQASAQAQGAPQMRPASAGLSRHPVAPPRPRRPLGRPARRTGYVRQAPGRAIQPEPVAVSATQPAPSSGNQQASASPYTTWHAGHSLTEVVRQARRNARGAAPATVRDQVLRQIDGELERAHAQLVEQRLRLLQESATLAPKQRVHRRR